MNGFFVNRRGIGGSVGFNQHKASGVVPLLDDIKPSDSRFLDAGPRVGQGCETEGLNALGFHAHVNMHHKHVGTVKVRAAEIEA